MAVNKPWSSIVERCRGHTGKSRSIRAVEAMFAHIANGPLATALFAWTSMFDVCITQTPVAYPCDGPFLLVSPRLDGQVEFRYIDTREKEKQWVRVEKPERGVSRLHLFLRQLKWVSESLLQNEIQPLN